MALWLPHAAADVPESAPKAAPPTLEAIYRLELRDRADATTAIAELERLRPSAPRGSDIQRELLTALGVAYAERRQPVAAEALARELADLAAALGDAATAAASQLVYAHIEERDGDLTRAEQLVSQSLQTDPSPPLTRRRYRMWVLRSTVEFERGRIDVALAAAQEAQRVADSVGDARLRQRAREQLANVLSSARQDEKALAYADEAVALANAGGDPGYRSQAYNLRALVLGTMGRVDEQRDAMRTAIGLADQAGWRSQQALLMANSADSYLRTSEYEAAKARAQQALPLARESRNTTALIVAYANLGLAELGAGEVEPGRAHLEEALAMERHKGAMQGEADILAEMAPALERAGDLTHALEGFLRLRELQDQLRESRRQRAVLRLQQGYQREEQAREIALLARQGQLQDEQLRAEALRHRLWMAGSAAGALVLLVLALLLREGRRVNARMALTNELLRVQGGQDPLTGLANRRQVHAVLRGREGAFVGTVMLVDIDHFKRINDTVGHAGGDVVLVEVARRLRETLRNADLLARWGGEEFLVVLPTLPQAQTEAFALRLLHAIGDASVPTPNGPLRVTASIGFAGFPLPEPTHAMCWEDALHLVDTALYIAKGHGRNRACGVRRLSCADAMSLSRPERALEDAWHAGEAELSLIGGPAPVHGALEEAAQTAQPA
jgi:diguanylate cyclase (GGDEF)-like protein